MIIKIKVENQHLTASPEQIIVSDSVGVVQFSAEFDEPWQGTSITVFFQAGDTRKSVLYPGGVMDVPWEVLKTGPLRISVVGVAENYRITTARMILPLNVICAGSLSDQAPAAETLEAWEQALLEAKAAAEAAQRAALLAENYPQIRGGTWWIFDKDQGKYVDTGISAQGPQGDSYTLPVATTQKLGGIKGSASVQIAQDGTAKAHLTAKEVGALPLTGGTVTGNIVMSQGTELRLGGEPTGDQMAANKAYVDQKCAGERSYTDQKIADERIYVDQKCKDERSYIDQKCADERAYIDGLGAIEAGELTVEDGEFSAVDFNQIIQKNGVLYVNFRGKVAKELPSAGRFGLPCQVYRMEVQSEIGGEFGDIQRHVICWSGDGETMISTGELHQDEWLHMSCALLKM